MTFPKFLKIATLARNSMVQINSTFIESKSPFDKTNFEFIYSFAKVLGFSFQLLTPQDGEYGRELPNGSWTGIIGMIQRNEVDLAFSSISMSLQRLKVVKFSYPYQRHSLVFATRRVEYKSQLTAFLAPFSIEVWLLLSLCFITIPLVLTIIFRNKNQFQNTVWNMYKSLIGQSIQVNPGHYIIICWIAASTILSFCFKAVLLSFLTFPSIENIRSFPQLAKAVTKGTHQCTTSPGSFAADVLKSSTDPNLRIIGDDLQRNNKSSHNFVAVLNDTKSEKKPAFIGSDILLHTLKKPYIVAEDELLPSFLAVPMRKNFCCKARLDHIISHFWAHGLYRKLEMDYSFRNSLINFFHSPESFAKNKERQLSVDDLKGVFVILLIGYLLAIVIFIFEVTVFKYKVIHLLPKNSEEGRGSLKSGNRLEIASALCRARLPYHSEGSVVFSETCVDTG